MYTQYGALKKDDAPLLGLMLQCNSLESELPDMIIANQEFLFEEAFAAGWTPNEYRFIYGTGGNNEIQRFQLYNRVKLINDEVTPSSNDVVFIAGIDNGTSTGQAGAFTIEKEDIKIDVSNGMANSSHYRIYKNETLTISSTKGIITQVAFECIGNDDAQYGPGCFTVNPGNYQYSGKIGTWTGAAENIVFTASSNQVRANKITVTLSQSELVTTPAPVIEASMTDESVFVTATGEGEVKLYKEGSLVNNPYIINRTNTDQSILFTATAQKDGCLISETASMTIIVPAKEVDPGGVYKPVNVTVYPDINTADVSWEDSNNSAWNLRYRVVLPGVNNNLLWDFEEDTNGNTNTSLPGGWTCIDADGDGHEWYHLSGDSYMNHSGIGHVTSSSWYMTADSTGIALNPDNWLVSPMVKIDGELSFWACAQDPNWSSEVFRVYTSTNKVNWVPISDDITATGRMTEYTFDLTPYACENGYVAIRHYNVTDMFRLNVDDIAITYVKPAEWIYVENLDVPYYTIEDLDPGTNYEVQVQGINNNEETSDWTESIVFTTSVLLGDVNYDCMVNIADLNEMLNIIFYDGAFVVAADMNTDLIINVQDVVGLVHYLLNGEIPSLSTNGRRAPKAETAGQASLYWQDGVLYLSSDVPVSALNLINDVDGDITWNLDSYGMVVMQESGASGEHAVIFSFDRNVIPPGVTAIATTNSQAPSVLGAELSTLDSNLIPVTLNDQITGLTSIQAAGEINCYMDGSNLVIDNNAILRDLDITAYTIDGRVLANQHVSFLDSGSTSSERSDIIKSNRYLIIVVRNDRQILATQKLTQNR